MGTCVRGATEHKINCLQTKQNETLKTKQKKIFHENVYTLNALNLRALLIVCHKLWRSLLPTLNIILMNSDSSSSRNFLRISLQTSSKYITPFFSTCSKYISATFQHFCKATNYLTSFIISRSSCSEGFIPTLFIHDNRSWGRRMLSA